MLARIFVPMIVGIAALFRSALGSNIQCFYNDDDAVNLPCTFPKYSANKIFVGKWKCAKALSDNFSEFKTVKTGAHGIWQFEVSSSG